MEFLLAAILLNIIMTFVIKYAEKDPSYSRQGALTFNYLLATVISYLQLPDLPYIPGSVRTQLILMGVANGFLFLAALYLMQVNIALNDAPLTATFNRMGIFIPTLASIFLFKEFPNGLESLGLVLCFACILGLVYLRKKKTANYKFLLYLLIASGCTDLLNKIFSISLGDLYKNYYIFYTFLSALLFSLLLHGRQKRPYKRQDVFYGFLIGLPNQINNLMMMKAVLSLPGYIVFPSYSGGIILLVNVANYLLFRKKPDRREFLISLVIILSIVLIKVTG